MQSWMTQQPPGVEKQNVSSVPRKRQSEQCCIVDTTSAMIEQREEEISQHKHTNDYEQVACDYERLFEIYKSRGDMDNAIMCLREKLKYEDDEKRISTFIQLIAFSDSNSMHLQAGHAAEGLARLYDGAEEFEQALLYYRLSSQAFEMCPEPPEHQIRKNHISVSFVNFKAENYADAARNFEKNAREFFQNEDQAEVCAKYMLFSFISLCMLGNNILVEEVPLRFELVFGDILQRFPAQRVFIEEWSSGVREVSIFQHLDDMYAADADWELIRAQVVRTLFSEAQQHEVHQKSGIS